MVGSRSLRLRRGTGLLGRGEECDVLDGLVEGVCRGESRVLVVRGEPGIGKTALLKYLVQRASKCQVSQAVGVQSEMELAFAGLHQLLMPLLGRIEDLPASQRDALSTAFGIGPGSAPDRFLVSLAVLSLLSDAAEVQPLVCVVDDEQWLDRASVEVLEFVARRLGAESVGLVFAVRESSNELAGLPKLTIGGLREVDANALLDSVLTGPMDVRVRHRIVAEAHGNPLALLELPRCLTPAELLGGFGLRAAAPLAGRLEAAFERRVDSLPPESRLLLLIAAAEPAGDPVLVWRAADLLGIPSWAATPVAEAGLLEFGSHVLFRHPIVRTVAYWSGVLRERQRVHQALADAIDPELYPESRAWHRAQAASGLDEDVALELESAAGRARARGGSAAAAALLERSAMLTFDQTRRAERLLAAARATRDAGALEDALSLLAPVETGPPDSLRIAEVEHLRGQIALMQRRGEDAGRLLLSAAGRLTPIDAGLARQTHLESLRASIWQGNSLEAAKAARVAPAGPHAQRDIDVLLDGLSIRLTKGHAAAAPVLAGAVEAFLGRDAGIDEESRWLWIDGASISADIALDLWDAESSERLARRMEQYVREGSSPMRLQFVLAIVANADLLAGKLDEAAMIVDEHHVIAEVTRTAPVAYVEMMLAAWRGDKEVASNLIGISLQHAERGSLGRLTTLAKYSTAVLYNGLGQYDAACEAATKVFENDELGMGPLVVPELVEAASRIGATALVRSTHDWVRERARESPSDWALGTEAGVRALLSDGEEADNLFRESIKRLERTCVRPQVARAHLRYGEWLRRERRRVDARVHLRRAHEMLGSMGVEAFAERARRELLATGQTVQKRSVQTSSELTPQEAQIVSLARLGLSNPEIGTRLFISPRTVQYHLHKVFLKLDISAREQLDSILPGDDNAAVSARPPTRHSVQQATRQPWADPHR